MADLLDEVDQPSEPHVSDRGMRPPDVDEAEGALCSPWLLVLVPVAALLLASGVARPKPVYVAPERVRFDPNTVPVAILASLPMVGKSLTDRIEEARELAPLRSEDDLDRIKGVGPRMVGLLRPYLVFEREESSPVDSAVERTGSVSDR